MRAMLVSLVIASGAPLACSAPLPSPSATAATPAPATAVPTERLSIRYVALGDSYTIGTSIAASGRWPDQLVERLKGTIPLQLVDNLAVNGYSSADLINHELPDLGDLQPDFVSVLIGVNDVVRGVSLDRYRANVAQILNALLDEVPRERIMVVSTPDYTRTPRGADFGNPEQQRAGIADANSIMAEAARERGIAYVDISSAADQAGADPALVADDLLHPSAVQYARWVDLIAPVVSSLFGAP